MKSTSCNELIIEITDIHSEDGFHGSKTHNLIGGIVLAEVIAKSGVKGYYSIKGIVVRESDQHLCKIGEHIAFWAVKYKGIMVEAMIQELQQRGIGIDEYIL